MVSGIRNALYKILIFSTLIALSGYAYIYYQAHQLSQRITMPDKITYESQTTIIPLEEVNDKYFVKVFINGKGPFKLQLDSGSAVTVLHERVINEAKITDPVPLFKDENNKFYLVDKLKIGTVSFDNYIIKADTSYNQFAVNDGVLALSAFKEKLITINLSQKYIKLSDGELSVNDKYITAIKEKSFTVCIPFLPCAKSKSIRPEATFTYVENDKKMNIDFLIDTGAQRSSINIYRLSDLSRIKYDLTKDKARYYNYFPFVGVQVETKPVRLQGQFYWNEDFKSTKPYAIVAIGPYTPLNKHAEKAITTSVFGDCIKNVIGTSVLKEMSITLDAKNNLMQMLPVEKTTQN